MNDLAETIMLTYAGRDALAQGNAVEAIRLLSKKHKLVASHFGESSVYFATSAVDLAEANTAMGDFKAAKRLVDVAIDRYRELGIDDDRLVRALGCSAVCSYRIADYTGAEREFLSLIKRFNEAGVARSTNKAMVLDHLAQLYLRQGKIAEAEELLMEALAIFEQDSQDPSRTAVCLRLLARVRMMSERYREAEPLQRRAIEMFELVGDDMSLAEELDHLGITLGFRAQAEHDPALAALGIEGCQRALAIFEGFLPEGHPSLIGCRRNFAKLESLAATIGKMFPHHQYVDAQGVPDPHGHPIISQLIARSQGLSGQNKYDEALEVAREALDQASRCFGVRSALAFLARVQELGVLRRHCSYLLGEPTGVLSPSQFLEMQIRAHTRRGLAEDEATVYPQTDADVVVRVVALVSEALTRVETAFEEDARTIGAGSRRAWASDALELLHFARRLNARPREWIEAVALRVMQIWGTTEVGTAFSASVRSALAGDAYRAQRKDLRLATLERETIIRALVESTDEGSAARAAEASDRLRKLEERITALRESLDGDVVGEARNENALSLFAVRQSLDDHEALIAMFVGARAVFIVATSRMATTFKRVEIEEGLVREMCRAVADSASMSGTGELPTFDMKMSMRVYDLLFLPLRTILADVRHMVVLPDGPIWSVPPNLLLTEPMDVAPMEAIAQDPIARQQVRMAQLVRWLDGRSSEQALEEVAANRGWLGDKHDVSLIPSLESLAFRANPKRKADARRVFLGIGDPGASKSKGLPPIPEARHLLHALATALGGDPFHDVLVGRAATVDRLIELNESQDLAARRVICFATHSVPPEDGNDLLAESGLLFANDEVLTAFDLSALNLDADLVLLVACHSSAESGRAVNEPLSGLPRSFLAAGARAVVVSHWPVDVHATSALVLAMAARLGAGQSLAASLAAASKEVRGTVSHSHPAFWASFSIVGDGAFVAFR